MLDWDAKRAEAVQHALDAGFGEADAQLLAATARPALRLVAVRDGEAEVGTSKLGGLPDLAPSIDWPVGEYGPMTFCGQVRTRDAAALDGVDGWRAGDLLLSFFVDKDPDGDWAHRGRVLASAPHELVRREPPPDLPRGPSLLPESRFEAIAVLTPAMDFGSPWRPELEHDFDQDDWAAWDRLYEALGAGEATAIAPHHQLFGHPWEISDPEALSMGETLLAEPGEEPDFENWPFRLLAQFTTDHDANVEFADLGVIYFVIRASDLAAGNYDRVAAFMESC